MYLNLKSDFFLDVYKVFFSAFLFFLVIVNAENKGSVHLNILQKNMEMFLVNVL